MVQYLQHTLITKKDQCFKDWTLDQTNQKPELFINKQTHTNY